MAIVAYFLLLNVANIGQLRSSLRLDKFIIHNVYSVLSAEGGVEKSFPNQFPIHLEKMFQIY